MAGTLRALRTEVVPAWQTFVREAIPFGTASAAAAAITGTEATGSWSAKSHAAASLRRHLSGGVGQPTGETVWAIAETARTIAGCEWCAGPLFLFAAGHFEGFAQTMDGANTRLLTTNRFRQLLESIEAACLPSLALDDESFVKELRAQSVADTVIQKQLRRRRSRDLACVRPDRSAWILTDEEEAALTQSYLARSQTSSLTTITAHLCELHPEIKLANQRAIVLTALRSARP